MTTIKDKWNNGSTEDRAQLCKITGCTSWDKVQRRFEELSQEDQEVIIYANTYDFIFNQLPRINNKESLYFKLEFNGAIDKDTKREISSKVLLYINKRIMSKINLSYSSRVQEEPITS